MITEEKLNSEIDLSKRIYLYYLDKMSSFISIGSDKYIARYKDLCVLYFLCRGLISIRTIDSKFYIGDQEIDEDVLMAFTSRIREYLNNDIKDIVYVELDSHGNVKDYTRPIIPPTIVSYQNYNQDWRSTIITIDIDDVNSITLPFNISDVDPDSIRVVVNDNDPIPLVQSNEEGVTIVGSTLSWHTYYNLKAGDKVFIQYLLNIV